MAVQPGPTEKRYAANGVSLIYTVPFLVIEAGDLQVLLNGTLITSGFTHVGVGLPISYIEFTLPPTGDLLLQLNVPFQRLNDYQENGDFLSSTVNRDFDRIWQALKQLLRTTTRSPVLGINDIDGAGFYRAKGNGLINLASAGGDPTAAANWKDVLDYVALVLAAGQGPISNAANVLFQGQGGQITNVQALSGVNGAALLGWRGHPLSDALLVIPEHFGAKGDGVTDDTIAVQAWLDGQPQHSTVTGKPGSKYNIKLGVQLNVPGTILTGAHFIYPKTTETFYHAIRIAANDCKVVNNRIESPVGLVRNDTGFAILIGGCDNAEVSGNTIERTASAAIWAVGATNFRIFNNDIFFPAADGIHVSDNCRSGIVIFNTLRGTHDDALAVVGDTPSMAPPLNIVVACNIVDGTVAGHGLSLIACDSVIGANNILRATAFAGICSYFWNLTGAPVAKDWATNCLLVGNQIIAPGQAPLNVNNNTGILSGSFRDSTLQGNKIFGPAAEPIIDGSPAISSCIRLVAQQGLSIIDNDMIGSPSYGVMSPDSNANEAANFTGIKISRNNFKNIAKSVLRINHAAATVGTVFFTRNELDNCGTDAGTTANAFVSKTGANLLVISDNNAPASTKPFTYDALTCTNVQAFSNTPPTRVTWTPVAAPKTGTWTTYTSSGDWYRIGKTVFFRATVTVTNKGTGAGMAITLPLPVATGGASAIMLGRESANTGALALGYLSSLTQLDVITVTNGDPITANNASILISGNYLAA